MASNSDAIFLMSIRAIKVRLRFIKNLIIIWRDLRHWRK